MLVKRCSESNGAHLRLRQCEIPMAMGTVATNVVRLTITRGKFGWWVKMAIKEGKSAEQKCVNSGGAGAGDMGLPRPADFN